MVLWKDVNGDCGVAINVQKLVLRRAREQFRSGLAFQVASDEWSGFKITICDDKTGWPSCERASGTASCWFAPDRRIVVDEAHERLLAIAAGKLRAKPAPLKVNVDRPC